MNGTINTGKKALLKPQEVSQLLSVPVNRLTIWRITGVPELEFIKCGRSIRYSPEAVDAFIRKNTAKHTGSYDAK